MVHTRVVETGQVALTVAEAGAGGTPLLLLHGFTGAKEDFTEWLGPLADRGWHAVAPDHRGHGESAKPAGADQYSMAIIARDSAALADALGWTRFAVLGHSMGGFVAQLLAVADPGRLLALVLMDTGHGPVDGLDRELVHQAGTIALESGMDALADAVATVRSPIETAAHRRLLDERPGYGAFGDRKLRATSPWLYASIGHELADGEDFLARVAAMRPAPPTLVLVGEQDAPFRAPADRLVAAIPGATLTVIPDAGHSPQFENPVAWWDALSSFLDTVAERTAT